MTNIYSPFREMDRAFNQALRSVRSEGSSMAMDLYRKGDEFIVKIDLPGVDADSIDIDIDDRTLTIRAERTMEEIDTDDGNSRWVSRERSYGSFARQLTLGAGLDLAGVTADYTDGVLTLTIPVAEEAKPRKVKVNQGSVVRGEVESSEEDGDN